MTAVNVQELAHGSEELIEMLLQDLGSEGGRPLAWSLSEPFAVNYLSADPTDDWRDTWLLTWRLELRGGRLPDLPSEPVDLAIWDSSWDGKEAVPVAFELIATQGSGAPDLNDMRVDSTERCSEGHLHVRVVVESLSLDSAAAETERIQSALRDSGWATTWLEAKS